MAWAGLGRDEQVQSCAMVRSSRLGTPPFHVGVCECEWCVCVSVSERKSVGEECVCAWCG